MTDEEMRSTIQFILESQARATAQIDTLADIQRAAQREADERWKRADERWARTEESIRALLTIAEIHQQEINKMSEAQARLAKTQAEAQDRIDKQMAETGERLDALINMVERYLSKGQNGQ